MKWTSITNNEEKQFLKTVLEYHEKSVKQYRMLATSFYNKEWMEEVLHRYGILSTLTDYCFMGGYPYAERNVLVFGYDEAYMESPIRVLKITVKTGIGKDLTHRDFLGALLGLGLKRETIGDIVLKSFGAYVMVTEELSDFISCHLMGIGRYQNIEVEEIPFNEMEIEAPKFKECLTTVSSLRVDAIFAAAFNLSRGDVTKYLQNDKGKLNGVSVKTSQLMKVGDVGTLRGYGKIRLAAVNGVTKKDRIHITVEKYI